MFKPRVQTFNLPKLSLDKPCLAPSQPAGAPALHPTQSWKSASAGRNSWLACSCLTPPAKSDDLLPPNFTWKSACRLDLECNNNHTWNGSTSFVWHYSLPTSTTCSATLVPLLLCIRRYLTGQRPVKAGCFTICNSWPLPYGFYAPCTPHQSCPLDVSWIQESHMGASSPLPLPPSLPFSAVSALPMFFHSQVQKALLVSTLPLSSPPSSAVSALVYVAPLSPAKKPLSSESEGNIARIREGQKTAGRHPLDPLLQRIKQTRLEAPWRREETAGKELEGGHFFCTRQRQGLPMSFLNCLVPPAGTPTSCPLLCIDE